MGSGKIRVPDDVIEVPDDAVEVPQRVGMGDVRARDDVEPPPPEPPEEMSIPETALHSGLQGISGGFSDEAQGLIGGAAAGASVALEGLGLKDKPEDLADPLTGESTALSTLERIAAGYKQARNWEREAVHEGERTNPKTARGFELAGAVASPTLPGLKGAGLAKQGLVTGGVFGLGKSESPTLGGDVSATAEGAGGGYVAGRAMQSLAPLLQRYLKGRADRSAFKAMDPYQKSVNALEAKSPAGQPMAEADRLGRKALDLGLVKPFDKSLNVARRAAGELDETGKLLGGTVQRIQDESATKALSPAHMPGLPVSQVELAQKLDALALNAEQSAGTRPLAAELRAQAENARRAAQSRQDVGKTMAMTLPEAEKAKTELMGLAKYDKTASTATEQARQQAARTMREINERAVEGLAGPEELAQFKALKQRYGDIANIEELSSYGAGRQARNNELSLGDYQAAQAFGKGGPIPDWAWALLNKLGRERGAATVATGANALSKVSGGPAATRALASQAPDAEDRRRIFEWLKSLKGDVP